MSLCNDIIKINYDVFKDYYKNLCDNKIPNFLLKKKADIYTYKCYHISYDSFYSNEKKWITKNDKYEYRKKKIYDNNTNNKFHIISVDFTEDGKIKKQFTGILNKLTLSNNDILYKKIIELYNISNNEHKKIFYELIWNFIKKSPIDSYIKLLDLFDFSYTQDYWNKYINEKKWMPDSIFIDNDLLSNNTKLYDIYCEYIKWKNEYININKAWCNIWKKNNNLSIFNLFLDNLYNDIILVYQNETQSHIFNYALEQLYIILKIYKNNEFIEKIKLLDISKYHSSSKFIILDILDLET